MARAIPSAFLCAILCVLLCVLLCAACASPGFPPGGAVDRLPPVLVRVTPDTGTLNVRPRDVVFQFDKVISERPASVQSLEQLVVVSPTEGVVNVDWHRQQIRIRPRKGWRANTAYSVTILPGLSDLQGNATRKPVRTEFSTGASLASGTIRGVAFDWVAQAVVRGALIEAVTGADTNVRYVATSDSTGRFSLGGLPAGAWRVRAVKDDNRNGRLDSREPFDSATMTVADSVRRDFYLFVHDSIGPRPSNVTALDSLTVRVPFDKPLSPLAPLDSGSFVLRRRSDSSVVLVRRAIPATIYDSLASQRKKLEQDAAAQKDTSTAGRRARARADSLGRVQLADSLAKAQVAALKASRDTVGRDSLPKPARRAPVSGYVLELATPLVPLVPMELEIRGVTNLNGATRTSLSRFFLPKAAPVKSDSAGAPPRTKKP